MFGLSLFDHLRLTFGHVIYSHKAHAQAAEKYSRWDRWLKLSEALLLVGTLVSAVALAFTNNPSHAVLTAFLATMATLTLLARLVTDFERTSYTHRTCSAHLWHMREQYRALLSDLTDGALTPEGARERRDHLMAALHRVYEQAPPAERSEYENARRGMSTTDEAALSDEEIDRFLPASLQKPHAPADATS